MVPEHHLIEVSNDVESSSLLLVVSLFLGRVSAAPLSGFPDLRYNPSIALGEGRGLANELASSEICRLTSI